MSRAPIARFLHPPGVLLAYLLILPAVHLLATGPIVVHWPWRGLGTLSVVAGLALNVVADRQFTAHRTSVKPQASPRVLVTDGPFALSRNPMYLGFGLIIGGVALLLGSVGPLLLASSFLPLASAVFVRDEERRLEAAFGDAWTEYRQRVGRWVRWPRARRGARAARIEAKP